MVAPVTPSPSPIGDMLDSDVTVQTVGYTEPELGAKDLAPFVASSKQASSAICGVSRSVMALTYLILCKWLRVRGW